MPGGRPPKPVGETVHRTNFSYRPDQEAKVKELQRRKALSPLLQKAIDDTEI